MPGAIAAELKWKSGTALRLFIGSGDTAGKLKLEPSDDGSIHVGRTTGEALLVHIGVTAPFRPTVFSRRAVTSDVDGRALVVTLPHGALSAAN